MMLRAKSARLACKPMIQTLSIDDSRILMSPQSWMPAAYVPEDRLALKG
jgi:hypothetical protein